MSEKKEKKKKAKLNSDGVFRRIFPFVFSIFFFLVMCIICVCSFFSTPFLCSSFFFLLFFFLESRKIGSFVHKRSVLLSHILFILRSAFKLKRHVIDCFLSLIRFTDNSCALRCLIWWALTLINLTYRELCAQALSVYWGRGDAVLPAPSLNQKQLFFFSLIVTHAPSATAFFFFFK